MFLFKKIFVVFIFCSLNIFCSENAEKIQDGDYSLQNVFSNLYLDTNENKQVYTDDNKGPSHGQTWKLISYTGGENNYLLQNVFSNLYLDTNENKQVYTTDINGGYGQTWKLISYTGGENNYLLQNVFSNLYLETNENKQVYTTDINGGYGQTWKLFLISLDKVG